MVDVAIGVELERVIVAVLFRMMHGPNWEEDGRVLGYEHAFVPVILGCTAWQACRNTIAHGSVSDPKDTRKTSTYAGRHLMPSLTIELM